MLQYSARTQREAVVLYESGLSCRATAEKMRVVGVASPHYVTVLRWAKEAGKARTAHGHRLAVSTQAVRDFYDKGIDVYEIAQRFHVGKATIYKRLHEAGTKMRPSRIRYGHVFTAGRLRTLYTKKNSRAQDIAAKLGCSVGTVYNWLRRNHVPLKRPQRTPRCKAIAGTLDELGRGSGSGRN